MCELDKQVYNKLSYVPLPNLKKCLKEHIKDEELRDKIDKYTKSEVITQFRSLNLKEEDVLKIYKQYKFGKNLSFQLFYTNKQLAKIDFSIQNWKCSNKIIDLSNIKYENLPRVKSLQFTDVEILDENMLEVGYKYHALHKYFKDNEEEEPAYIYETQYGFLWINVVDSYFVIISKDEKIVQDIKEFLYTKFNLKLTLPQLTKETLNKIFLPENTKSATYTETYGATAKVSYPSTAKEYEQNSENIINIVEQIENNGTRKANAKYKEMIVEGELESKSVISVNADKCRISVHKTCSADQIRNWGKVKFSQITNELSCLKQYDISQYFDVFAKEILQGHRLPKNELMNIKSLCGALYNAVIQKKNCEIPNVNITYNTIDINRYFHVLPLFDCPSCNEIHDTKCYSCETIYQWKNGLYCPTCKTTHTENVFLKCDNESSSNKINVSQAITLIPNSKLLEILSSFILQTGETFDPKYQNFYIRNNKLYYKQNISKTELRINDFALFKDIDINMQLSDPTYYQKLKNECVNLPEKCKYSKKSNCINCLSDNSLYCLMKMFAFIEPSFKPQPHKGGEYGDVSFTASVNGSQKTLKFIMKSAEKNGIVLTTSKTGKEFLIQTITQYVRDNYKPVLVLLTPSQFDAYLKADITNIVRLVDGQVIFIEEKELIAIYKLSKEKGFTIQ